MHILSNFFRRPSESDSFKHFDVPTETNSLKDCFPGIHVITSHSALDPLSNVASSKTISNGQYLYK